MALSNWSQIALTGRTTVISKIAATVLLFQLSVSSAAPPALGFIQHSHGKFFIETPAALHQIDSVHYQFLSDEGDLHCCRRAGRKDLKPVRPSEDQQLDAGPRYRYEIRTAPRDMQTRFFIGSALINVRRPVQTDVDTVTGRTDKGFVYTTRRCIEREGINLSASSHGTSISLYYSLGYDVDLTAVNPRSVCAKAK